MQPSSQKPNDIPPHATVSPFFWEHFSVRDVADWTRDARQRTLDLIVDLDDRQLLGPYVETVNPLLWEIGHVAWFQEKWVLRHFAKQAPVRADADALYDSMAIAHDTRWDLPLPARGETLEYMQQVHERVLARLEQQPSNDETFLHLMALFHEDMHTEAFLINRQCWGFAKPKWSSPSGPPRQSHGEIAKEKGPLAGDVEIPGGTFLLGATFDEPFVFDNEKWAHEVQLAPFKMARAPVTQSEFVAFVEDGGYQRRALWSEAGWSWREKSQAEHPVYWREENVSRWQRRDFDRWVDLEPHRPVINVCRYEAEAYCNWAQRRLPTEAEWEAAASLSQDTNDITGIRKRRFPWGDSWPQENQVNLDGFAYGCADVAAYPKGDSVSGCRQMIGNVWEWTTSDFVPFPGFVPDPYKEYSQPWFYTHKVLRGGCWATRGRMLRNTWRSFYQPDRCDVWAGFRTCAL